MSHFIKLCKECGAIIAQCRCMCCEKKVEYGICNKCEDKGE